MKMTVQNLLDEINDLVDAFMTAANEVVPAVLGLDDRCAHRLYVTEDAIIVNKSNDKSLQYYGGFEYVLDESRHEIGDWVFYSAEHPRVAEHLSRYCDENA